MQGYRFYRDLGSAQGKQHFRRNARKRYSVVASKVIAPGNVIAISLDHNNPRWYWNGTRYCVEGLMAVHTWDNSAVAGSSVSDDYLRACCIRVSETVARQIHPNLFKRLDA
jgi:hypothetical protein